MSLIDIHSRLANTALYYMIIMTLWGGWRYLRKQGVDSNYWGAMVIAEILFFVQGSLGAYLYFSGIGQLAGRTIHILYGVVSLLVLPAVYMYTRGDEQRRSSLVYSASFLFLIGIVIRAMMTAAG